MVSLDPTDYISLCDVLPSELSVLCTNVAGVPLWAMLALFAAAAALVLVFQLVALYIRVMTPL